MPLAYWRTACLIVLAGLLGLQGTLPIVAGLDQALAATEETRREQPHHSKRSHTEQISMAPGRLSPAMIENLRTAVEPGSTRLVLDLDRKTRARKYIPAQADGVILEIPHAILSKSAQTKIANGTLAKPFVIKQTSADTVAVSFVVPLITVTALLSWMS